MGLRTNKAVWQEKTGRWKISVQKDGVRKSFYSSTPGRAGQREAHAKADAWLDQDLDGFYKKVKDVYPDFLKTKELGTSKRNHYNIKNRYENHVLPVIGNKKIASLTEPDLQLVIDKAFKEKGLSAKTLRDLRGDLTAFLKYCRQSHLSSLLPEGLRIPASAARAKRTIVQPEGLRVLFREDTTLIRGAVGNEPYIHYYRLAVLTGLRPGELRGLMWGDIVGNTMHIQRAINIDGEMTEGKNQNAIRTVILSPVAVEVLQAQYRLTGSQAMVFDLPNQDCLLKHWRRYCDYHDIPKTSIYELRHTFVSIAQQLPEGMVKKLVGHSQAMDTWGIYAHMVNGQQEDTAQRLGAVFTSILEDENT